MMEVGTVRERKTNDKEFETEGVAGRGGLVARDLMMVRFFPSQTQTLRVHPPYFPLSRQASVLRSAPPS